MLGTLLAHDISFADERMSSFRRRCTSTFRESSRSNYVDKWRRLAEEPDDIYTEERNVMRFGFGVEVLDG